MSGQFKLFSLNSATYVALLQFSFSFYFIFVPVPSGFKTNNSSENGSLWQNITIARLQSNWDLNE